MTSAHGMVQIEGIHKIRCSIQRSKTELKEKTEEKHHHLTDWSVLIQCARYTERLLLVSLF
jgi:hypothetical protein